MCFCFLRCTECHSTLLPGSYKLGSDSGALVCAHHLSRNALSNQNGRPDLTKRPVPVPVQSARTGRSTGHHAAPSDADQAEASSPVQQTNDTDTPASDSVTVTPVTTNKDYLDRINKEDGAGETEENQRSATPPNPFDESDDEEEEQGEKEEETQTPAKHTANGDLPLTPAPHVEGISRPVPAPRRVSDPTPPPRPAPRVRLPRAADSPALGKWFLHNKVLKVAIIFVYSDTQLVS